MPVCWRFCRERAEELGPEAGWGPPGSREDDGTYREMGSHCPAWVEQGPGGTPGAVLADRLLRGEEMAEAQRWGGGENEEERLPSPTLGMAARTSHHGSPEGGEKWSDSRCFLSHFIFLMCAFY